MPHVVSVIEQHGLLVVFLRRFTVQILGSGGPAINRERASSSYLLWIGGQARMLVDMGGGAYLRFGQSGAKLSDLALVAISHLHPDHVSDLPALLWLTTEEVVQQDPPDNEKGLDQHGQVGEALYKLLDARLELHRPHHAHLETEVAQAGAQISGERRKRAPRAAMSPPRRREA
jgi:ribonuclease BN (tRNA processing enzyme)